LAVVVSRDLRAALTGAEDGEPPTADEALALLNNEGPRLKFLMTTAARLRDWHFPWVTFSRNVFLPLTTLCRCDCGYCTFYKLPGQPGARYMDLAEVNRVSRAARRAGCSEALFTLGERPEDRYGEARDLLAALGYSRTNEYLVDACRLVAEETGLLPHSNPGVLTEAELLRLREVNASMGLMLESTSTALLGPGGPHHRCGSKHPQARLATMERAGRLRIPWTTGLLVGIGEPPRDRVESLLAIRALHERYGHIQEVIVQPFTPHPGTPMADHPPPTIGELVRLMAVARLVLPGEISLQAPPNLTPGDCGLLLAAGANDWGGISPLTIDYINPDHPWPPVERLRQVTEAAGLHLRERLPIYPTFALDGAFHHGPMAERIRSWADPEGYARAGPP
jgi:7,8-didemethyl-8-hydroxy-5-deazariboflavin synthase CofG subunit